jgi:hypothetical protein
MRIERMKLRTLATLGLLLLGATASADTVLYDLDAKNAKQIAEALSGVLTAQCTSGPKDIVTNQSMCKVELLPTNQLLVEAPAASQAQVAAALKAIAARNATPPPRMTLQYWVIYGAPGKPAAADASLKPPNAVLQQLERANGDLSFSVQDTVTITAQGGASATSRGGPLNVNETLFAGNGDDLNLFVRLQFAPKPLFPDLNVNLDVNVTIKKGEFVVLGERTAVEVHSGDQEKGPPIDIRQKPGMLFFVVHWQ